MAKRNKKNDTSFEQELRVSFAKEYNELKNSNPWAALFKARKQWQLACKKQQAAYEVYSKLQDSILTDSDEYNNKIQALSGTCSSWAEYTAIQRLISLDD